MWKDELLKEASWCADDLERSMTRKENPLVGKNRKECGEAVVFARKLVEDLKRSYSLHLDESMTEFVDEETHRRYDFSTFNYEDFLKDSFPMNLPYGDMLIEVPVDEKYVVAGRKYGAGSRVAYVLSSSGGLQTLRRAVWNDDRRAWDIHMVTLKYDMLTGKLTMWSIGDDDMSRTEKILLAQAYVAGVRVVTVVLDLLNCRNVASRRVMPSEKLNRARVKKGKLPLYEYHVLEVVKDLSGREKRELEARTLPWGYQVPEDKRLHMCRGHFKLYSEDRPLFGRYHGRFWWGPHMRGKEENGVVDKDYSMKAAGRP